MMTKFLIWLSIGLIVLFFILLIPLIKRYNRERTRSFDGELILNEELTKKIEDWERSNGNKNLTSSRISPRRQGKLRALRWVLSNEEML